MDIIPIDTARAIAEAENLKEKPYQMVGERMAKAIIFALLDHIKSLKPWKDCLIDALVINHTLQAEHQEDPHKALSALVQYEQALALDPAVSEEARALWDSVPAVTEEMVGRFLSWPLPEDFSPDAGITFVKDYNVGTAYPMQHHPVGTNLLNADQTKAMLEHVLGIKK